MASAGDDIIAQSITLNPSSSISPAGAKALETDGTDLYFDGAVVGVQTLFSGITTDEITGANDGNVLVSSNLVLQSYPGTINSVVSANQGLQAQGGYLYYNGDQLATATGSTQDIFVDTIQPFTSGRGATDVTSNLNILNIAEFRSSNIEFSKSLVFDTADSNIVYGTNLSLRGPSVTVTDDSSIPTFSLQSNDSVNNINTDLGRIKFKSTGDTADSTRVHELSRITSGQTSTFDTSSGGAYMDVDIRAADVPATSGTDPLAHFLTMRTDPATGNTIHIGRTSAIDNIRIGLNSPVYGSNTLQVGTSLGVDTANVEIGSGTRVLFDSDIKIKTLSSTKSIEIGHGLTPVTTGVNSISIGQDTEAKTNSVAIGGGASSSNGGDGVVSIGVNAGASSQGDYSVAIGIDAGRTNQDVRSVALGSQAGQTSQGANAVSIGHVAGYISQNSQAIAIGSEAAVFAQASNSISVGRCAGKSNQGIESIAIGMCAGESTQGSYSVSIGRQAGFSGQLANTVAIGVASGMNIQGRESVAIGYLAGQTSQGTQSVSIGSLAGRSSQGVQSVVVGYNSAIIEQGDGSTVIGSNCATSNQGDFATAIGSNAATFSQGSQATAIGTFAGETSQGISSTSIGYEAGRDYQNTQSLAIGFRTGMLNQNTQSVAIGYEAGFDTQNSQSTAIGYQAGYCFQSSSAIAIGNQAGFTSQCHNSIAIGNDAGKEFQSVGSISIGVNAGISNQSSSAIAIGSNAGAVSQQTQAMAIGTFAGETNQKLNSAAIGVSAGQTSQGQSSTAIGSFAGQTEQGDNSTAIGTYAGSTSQKVSAIAIGASAAKISQGIQGTAIGFQAGENTQGSGALAIGTVAGRTSQQPNATAIGASAGATCQQINAVAIGRSAGTDRQGSQAVAIGFESGRVQQSARALSIGNRAGEVSQGADSTAIGLFAGQSTQGILATAIGPNAGSVLQGNEAMALGSNAGTNNQQTQAIALGSNAGTISQNTQAVAIGVQAGELNQNAQAIAIGFQAGQTDQKQAALSIGYRAGQTEQNTQSMAIGYEAGLTTQNAFSAAMGYRAGYEFQGEASLAVGFTAGHTSQSSNSAALGYAAGYLNQGEGATAIGFNAGYERQGSQSMAIGFDAGRFSQNTGSVAIGFQSGYQYQNNSATAIGYRAGYEYQNTFATAIGFDAGKSSQGVRSVAIGAGAGFDNQGDDAIAIGTNAGRNNQGSNSINISTAQNDSVSSGSIVINASSTPITSTDIGKCYISPLNAAEIGSSLYVVYDTTTKEMYAATNFEFQEGVTVNIGGTSGYQPHDSNIALHIFQSTNGLASYNTGTIILDHGTDNGGSSIVFRNKQQFGAATDYGFIELKDNNAPGDEGSIFTIGMGGDSTGSGSIDRIRILTPGNIYTDPPIETMTFINGRVGVQTTIPNQSGYGVIFDINGNLEVRGAIRGGENNGSDNFHLDSAGGSIFLNWTLGAGNGIIVGDGSSSGYGTIYGGFTTADGGALGTTDGSNRYTHRNVVDSGGHIDKLDTYAYRRGNASGWTSTEWYIQRIVDITFQNYMVFKYNYTEFGLGGTVNMTIDHSTNRVGILTTAPEMALDVTGDTQIRYNNGGTHGTVSLRLNHNALGQGSGGGLLLQSQAGSGGLFYPEAVINTWTSGVSNQAPLVFKINNAEKMRLLTNGNLGIGKTPSQKLDVSGNMLINWSGGLIIADVNAGGGAYSAGTVPFSVISNPTSGILTLGLQNSTTSGSPASLGFFREDTSGNSKLVAGIYSINGTDAANATDGGMDFRIGLTGNNAGYTPLHTAVRINSYGNVGIGRTSPATRLDVNGSMIARADNFAGLLISSESSGYVDLEFVNNAGVGEAGLNHPVMRWGVNYVDLFGGGGGYSNFLIDGTFYVGNSASPAHSAVDSLALYLGDATDYAARWRVITGGYNLNFQRWNGSAWQTFSNFSYTGDLNLYGSGAYTFVNYTNTGQSAFIAWDGVAQRLFTNRPFVSFTISDGGAHLNWPLAITTRNDSLLDSTANFSAGTYFATHQGFYPHMKMVYNDTYNGASIDFRRVSQGVGFDCRIYSNPNHIYLYTTSSGADHFKFRNVGKLGIVYSSSYGAGFEVFTDTIAPANLNGDAVNGGIDLGASSYRWRNIYYTGSFNPSDRRLKRDEEFHDEQEKRVALKIKSRLKKFRYKDSFEKKGEGARIHSGIIAQDVEAAFIEEGLDPCRYSLFSKTMIYKLNGKTINKIFRHKETGEYSESDGDKYEYVEDLSTIPNVEIDYTYEIDYTDLMCFIIAAL